MKIVLQRVLEAKVEVDGQITGEIGNGYLLLVGVSNEDTKEIADKLIEKISRLRIFEDENGKTNLSIDQVSGEVLVVSQFTLYADCKKREQTKLYKRRKSYSCGRNLRTYFI